MPNKSMVRFYNRPFVLSILSGLFLALPWYESLPSFTVFFGFVPLFIGIDKLFESRHAFWRMVLYSYLAFFTWSLLATWWIYNATFIGAALAVIITALLMTIVMAGYYFIRKFAGKTVGTFGFVALWISYEQFFHNSEITWPWLTLGNSLGNHIWIIQWYEFTGTLGGSLWILMINFTMLAIVRAIPQKNRTALSRLSIFISGLILIPVIISVAIFRDYHEVENPVNVVVVQPNIDPYNEKFNGLTNDQQQDIILNLAQQAVDSTTDYVVCPETAIDDRIWEHELSANHSIRRIKDFVDKFPRAKWVTGVVSMKLFGKGDTIPYTARKYPHNVDYYYDRYNSAVQVDTSLSLPVYHKSKLVVGVEMMPYPQYMKFIEKYAIDLGGITGSLGTQPDRGVFKSPDGKFNVGPIICYESVFGEFVSGYIRNGANLLFVITNDGWWGNTPGYRQHLTYSRIRAIEMRRSIARSANTGVSALINQRGEVVNFLGWWKRGTITGTINASSRTTYYASNGDYIGRLSSFLALLTFAVALSKYLRRNRPAAKKI